MVKLALVYKRTQCMPALLYFFPHSLNTAEQEKMFAEGKLPCGSSYAKLKHEIDFTAQILCIAISRAPCTPALPGCQLHPRIDVAEPERALCCLVLHTCTHRISIAEQLHAK